MAAMTLTLVSLVVTAGAAMAQTSSYPPPVSVKGASGTDGGGGATAFTGSSQISVGTLMVVVLVLAGLTALFVARRRAARFAG
jgi:hypothetical protein